MTSPLPMLSRCSSCPLSTQVRISMSRCGCVGNPPDGATRSSLMTRSVRKLWCFGSAYSPNENVCRLSSQPPYFVTPRSVPLRTVSIGKSSGVIGCPSVTPVDTAPAVPPFESEVVPDDLAPRPGAERPPRRDGHRIPHEPHRPVHQHDVH